MTLQDSKRQLKEQLEEANTQAAQIQRDYDEKCADVVNLQNKHHEMEDTTNIIKSAGGKTKRGKADPHRS